MVTEALAPAWIAAALLVAVAIRTAPTPVEAVRWAVISALFASVLPFLYVVSEVRRRRVAIWIRGRAAPGRGFVARFTAPGRFDPVSRAAARDTG